MQLHLQSDQAGGGGFDFLHQDNHVELAMSIFLPTFVHLYGENAEYKAISGTPGEVLIFMGPEHFGSRHVDWRLCWKK